MMTFSKSIKQNKNQDLSSSDDVSSNENSIIIKSKKLKHLSVLELPKPPTIKDDQYHFNEQNKTNLPANQFSSIDYSYMYNNEEFTSPKEKKNQKYTSPLSEKGNFQLY